MNFHHDVSQLSNEELLVDLNQIVVQGHDATARLIAHIAEVDSRKLYLEHAVSSMFGYCLKRLQFSEGAAYRRIRAARAARRFPLIFDMVAEGKLHLSTVTMLAKYLTEENHQELLSQAIHKTKVEVEELIVSFAPKPDVKTEIRKLPVPKQSKIQGSSCEDSLQDATNTLSIPFPKDLSKPVQSLVGSPCEAAGTATALSAITAGDVGVSAGNAPLPKKAPAIVQPLGNERFKIQFMADGAFREKLLEAQELLRHQIPDGDIAQIFSKALAGLVEETKRKRFGKLKRPGRGKKGGSVSAKAKNGRNASANVEGETSAGSTSAKTEDDKSAGIQGSTKPKTARNSARSAARYKSRHIPSQVKREVYARDGGQCTFEDENGNRCSDVGFLEFHHSKPFALGGEHTASNIFLRCRAHNAHAAVQDFGPWVVKEKATPYLVTGRREETALSFRSQADFEFQT